MEKEYVGQEGGGASAPSTCSSRMQMQSWTWRAMYVLWATSTTYVKQYVTSHNRYIKMEYKKRFIPKESREELQGIKKAEWTANMVNLNPTGQWVQ
jgi:hypothetical protein